MRYALNLVFSLTLLAGCAQVAQNSGAPVTSGPAGAPAPTDVNQELVDQEGCRWWVVSRPSGLSWERIPNFRADCDAQSSTRASPSRLPALGNILSAPMAALNLGDDNANLTEGAISSEPAELVSVQPAQTEDFVPPPIVDAQPEPENWPELYIQAATFRSFDNAQRARQQVRDQGLPIYVPKDEAELDLHKIIVGPFKTESDRLEALRTLKFSGYPDAFLSDF